MTDATKPTIRQLLNQYKEELQKDPETEATKRFSKDIDAMAKEYDAISGIAMKYRTGYKKLVEEMKVKARIKRDEVISWCDDPEEIDPNLAKAIAGLQSTYADKAKKVTRTRNDAKAELNTLRSPLEKARAEEEEALEAFAKSKEFEKKVNDWFTELSKLHKEAEGHLEVQNYRLVYALQLEIDDIWSQIKNLNKIVGGDPAKTADWLLQELNSNLEALIAAKRARYVAHKSWLEKERAAATAQTNYADFVENNGRRKEFIREAQDVAPAAAPSTAA